MSLPTSVAGQAPVCRILVVLPRHLDAQAWAAAFARGEVPDETPYGYHFASRHGCRVSFSQPTGYSSGWARLVGRVLRRLLGFDLRHIWANRALIRSPQFDCIWTHTEYEHLGISLLQKFWRQPKVPLIAQSIWLIDAWSNYAWLRRVFYRWLMRDVAAATFHSPLNSARASSMQLARRVTLIGFGIAIDDFYRSKRFAEAATLPSTQRPIRILSLGNDRHRDWDTLVRALGNHSGYEIRIGSSCYPRHLQRSNIQVSNMDQALMLQNYAWADCVVLPLKHNLHASGLTTTLESVAMQVPLVCADTGGLSGYFDASLVNYFTVGDAQGLRCAVERLMAAPAQARSAQVQAAQRHLLAQQFTSEGFALRHVQLTQSLLASLS
jgi:glycosyltransferase involved in cell wall biosynthesis